jgi:hypothetical protein
VRPPALAGALIALGVGAVLRYAVQYTAIGVNIRIVGAIVMLAAVTALFVLLVQAVTRLQQSKRPAHRRDGPLQEPVRAVPGANRMYGQESAPAGSLPPPMHSSPAPFAVTGNPVQAPATAVLYRDAEQGR